MAKHIGIVACSAEGAALCYRTICKEAPSLMGRHHHPEITMHTHPLGKYMDYIYAGDWDGVAGLMISSSEIVKTAGAEFCISPDNTIHQAFKKVNANSPIPWMHIAEVVADSATSSNFKQLGILGTKYLMTGPVYPEVLDFAGINYSIPDKKEREEIDRIIFDELVNAVFTDESNTYFNRVIESLKNKGCDAVVLGCTEIPLIINPDTSPLPTLDSTRLLARAALKYSLE